MGNTNIPAGWYPDPAGSPAQRWWDGYRWTDALTAAPAPVPQTAPQAEPQVVHKPKRLLSDELYADAEGVRHGAVAVRWADAQWFGYSITDLHFQDTFIGAKVGKPQYYDSTLKFSMGRGRRALITHNQQVHVSFTEQTQGEVNEHWSGLVALCQKYLEPRLFDETLARIRAGERVDVGDLYVLDGHGVHVPQKRRSYPWATTQFTSMSGRIVLIPDGVTKRSHWFNFDPNHPNAILLPKIWHTLTGRSQ